ncbi:MAG: AmmeMemoRadiSam system protein B [Candidatus Omnitrophota bacterium]|nr:AmmeMemoRadiSam system protein B [Candidatus Omnitrophota bacterium]
MPSSRRVAAGAVVFVLALWLGAGAWVGAEPRTAQVAGAFYPADPAELRGLVQELLQRHPAPATLEKPRILIVPHAGYQYSGSVAAKAFRQLAGQTYDGVVVVGFTHRLPFAGSSVDTRESYVTPLGAVPIDQEAAALLLRAPGLAHVEEAHASGEHSLEVELPFLQVALERFRLVPVLMGSSTLADVVHLADALAALARSGEYLFVFSTDLSHYHPYEDAVRLDERTLQSLGVETPSAVDRLFTHGMLEACGRGPIVTSLLLAERLGYLRPELLFYANSGDTTGDRSRVVGYAALAMVDRAAPPAQRLSAEAGMALVRAARASLERSLIGQARSPEALSLERHPELSRPTGVFVTLRKDGRLRGCIGRITSSEPLATSVPVVALDAALHDPRFSPVRSEELDELEVEVSVLTPPVKLDRLEDLVPGRDGVILEYEGRSGVFLPQVWEETAWTRLEFLQELAHQKAGLPPDAWQRATLYVFQDQAFEEPPAPP